jgi:15-cis-phytoene synthase
MSIERKTAMHQYGTSYKRGTMFFNQETKHDTYILYTFLRALDNIVDNPTANPQETARAINKLRDQFHDLYNHTAPIDNELLQETVHLAHKYDMPVAWFDDFFNAMLADTKQTTYETYEQLQ